MSSVSTEGSSRRRAGSRKTSKPTRSTWSSWSSSWRTRTASASERTRPSTSRPSARRSTSSCRTSLSTRPGDGSLKRLLSLLEKLPEDLASQAFTHSSWTDQRQHSYERLAFLGDSVLNISVSQVLFPRFSSSSAGKLTKIRAQAVSRRSCVDVAREMGIPEHVREAAPKGYEHQAGRLVDAESVLAEAVEAVVGACFVEVGFARTSEAVAEAFAPQVEWALDHHSDFKSELQERLAQR